MSAEPAETVPLSVEACVSAVERSAGSGSESFRAERPVFGQFGPRFS